MPFNRILQCVLVQSKSGPAVDRPAPRPAQEMPLTMAACRQLSCRQRRRVQSALVMFDEAGGTRTAIDGFALHLAGGLGSGGLGQGGDGCTATFGGPQIPNQRGGLP